MKNAMNLKTKMMMASSILAANSAFAIPTVYPTKPGVLASVITNDQVNSKFMMDIHDDNAFYVLPPQKAYAYATGVSVANANLGFCQDMINVQAAGHVITERLKQITDEQDRYQPIVDVAEATLGNAQAAYDAYVANNSQMGQIAQINDNIRTNQDRLDSLYTKASSCTANCDDIDTEIRNIQASNRTLSNSRQALISQNSAMANKLASLQASVGSAQAALNTANARFANIAAGKSSLLKAFKDLYATYASLEGGTAYFEFTGDWEGQTTLLNNLNPGKKFTQIDAKNVQIDSSVMGADAVSLASMPAILSSTFDGRTNTNSTINVGTYPGQFTANVRLSLAGACPITHPADFQIGPIEAGKVKLGVSVKYEFDSAFNTKIDCTYDEKEMYKKLLSSGSSGFMFWKKSWQSIDISDLKSTEFACKWDGLPGASMSFADRRKFEIDALNYAISRMLMKYAEPKDIVVNQPPVPISGLSEMGQSLQSLCGATNIYCAAGGWLLKSFDSLFGSGQSTGSGTNTTESKVHLLWDENLTYPVSAQSNFNTDHI